MSVWMLDLLALQLFGHGLTLLGRRGALSP